MKTPEEIKKGLNICSNSSRCSGCPYQVYVDGSFGCEEQGCDDGLLPDAFAYIQQLEAERDAAVALIPRACAYCKWYGTKHGGFHPDCKNPNGCRNVSGINTGWQWRGVQKEDGNEKT